MIRKIIFINAFVILLSLPFGSAAHYITGIVNDALDGTPANGQTIILWNPSQGINSNITDIIGPTGRSGVNNIYLMDCEMLSPECQVGYELSLMVLNEGDNYLSEIKNVTVAGLGYDIVDNITLNSPPIFNSVIVEDELTSPLNELNLLPATTKTITCTSIITTYSGEDALENVSAVFFDNVDSSYNQEDDKNSHYTNGSCNINKDYGNIYQTEVNCSFDVWYYANPQTWNCTVNASDNLSTNRFGQDISTINPLLALGVDDWIQFGDFALMQVTDEVKVNVTNYGNVEINLSLSGYGHNENDGNAMNCTQGTTKNISIEYQKFNLTKSTPGDINHAQFIGNYTNLTNYPIPRTFELSPRTNDALNDANKTTYWRIYVPEGIAGNCQGNVVFGAVQSNGV